MSALPGTEHDGDPWYEALYQRWTLAEQALRAAAEEERDALKRLTDYAKAKAKAAQGDIFSSEA